MRSIALSGWAALALALVPCSVAAHSQRPIVRDIQLVPDEPSRVVAFAEAAGIMASRDDGQAFEFVCSASYAVNPYTEGVPPAALLKGGVIAVAAGTAGLRISRDDGCEFSRPRDFDGREVVDVTSADGAALYVLSTERLDATFVTTIFVSTDGGIRFVRAPAPTTTSAIATDLLVDGTGDRVYVMELDGDTGISRIERSRDAGKTFAPLPTPWSSANVRPRLAGLWREDADVFFVSTSEGLSQTDAEYALYLTTDAGESFVRLLTSTSSISLPAFSADGSKVAYGGTAGVHAARTAELVERGPEAAILVSAEPVYALGWSDSGLFAASSDPILVRIAEPFSGGEVDAGAITPVLDVCDLSPRVCATGTTLSECGSAPHFTAELAALDICVPGQADAGFADAAVGAPGSSHASGCTIRPASRGSPGLGWLVLGSVVFSGRRMRALAARRRSRIW